LTKESDVSANGYDDKNVVQIKYTKFGNFWYNEGTEKVTVKGKKVSKPRGIRT
jgi:hypothetical protein